MWLQVQYYTQASGPPSHAVPGKGRDFPSLKNCRKDRTEYKGTKAQPITCISLLDQWNVTYNWPTQFTVGLSSLSLECKSSLRLQGGYPSWSPCFLMAHVELGNAHGCCEFAAGVSLLALVLLADTRRSVACPFSFFSLMAAHPREEYLKGS